jgi:hypothetical protein
VVPAQFGFRKSGKALLFLEEAKVGFEAADYERVLSNALAHSTRHEISVLVSDI